MEYRDAPLQRVWNPDPVSSSPRTGNISPTAPHGISMSPTGIDQDVRARNVRTAPFIIVRSASS